LIFCSPEGEETDKNGKKQPQEENDKGHRIGEHIVDIHSSIPLPFFTRNMEQNDRCGNDKHGKINQNKNRIPHF